MEEVASMSKEVRESVSQLAGGTPTLLHAADFGWVHRARLYWGDIHDSTKGETTDLYSAHPPGTLLDDIHVI
eukprot:13231160-Heterocapsa_arctica.AAC.1